jgi:hypothetical protein
MGTTSNGRPWGENTGRVASGIFYGWAAKRGIEAAQRQQGASQNIPKGWKPVDGSEPADTRMSRIPPECRHEYEAAMTGVKVSGMWVGYVALWIIQGWYILNAVFMTTVNFFDPMQNGNWRYGTVSLVTSAPAVVFTVMAISAGRAIVARSEGLPPRKGEKYLALSWFPRRWWSLYLSTTLAFIPFYMVMNRRPLE